MQEELPNMLAPETPPPAPVQDEKDLRIAELEKQVKALENFANIVVGQRNEAQNQVAQSQAQLQGVLQNAQGIL